MTCKCTDELSGVTLWITGATGVIGGAIARYMQSRGAAVHAACRGTNRVNTEKYQDWIWDEVDLSDGTAVTDWFASRRDARFAVVVHAAGGTRDAVLPKLTPDAWDEVVDIHLAAAFRLVHAAGTQFTATGGSILLIGSRVGITGAAGQTAYAAAKAALVGLMLTAARELGEHGMRVNLLLPGFIPSPMTEGAPHAAARARREHLMNELGSLDALCSLATYLALPQTPVTGQVLAADGRPWRACW